MSDQFSEADHERARRAGQAAMAKIERDKKARQRPLLWRWLVNLALLTQFGAVVVAVVLFFHPVTFGFDSTAGAVAEAMTWPALISPHWLALLAALAAFFVAGLLAAPNGGESSAQSGSGREPA